MNNDEICMLCGEKLHTKKTNLEHYIPQTLIRSFDQLAVPNKFKYAERVNKCQAFSDERFICPLKQHKKWATIRVHEKCNLDASPMCQDMRKIIDYISNKPDFTCIYTLDDRIAKRIIEYYAAIWGNSPYDVQFKISSYESALNRMNTDTPCLVYRPYEMSCGRFQIHSASTLIEEHRHYIYFRENSE